MWLKKRGEKLDNQNFRASVLAKEFPKAVEEQLRLGYVALAEKILSRYQSLQKK